MKEATTHGQRVWVRVDRPTMSVTDRPALVSIATSNQDV